MCKPYSGKDIVIIVNSHLSLSKNDAILGSKYRYIFIYKYIFYYFADFQRFKTLNDK